MTAAAAMPTRSLLKAADLPSWFDPDRPEDTHRLRQLLQRREIHAPDTANRMRSVPAEPTLTRAISAIVPAYKESGRLADSLRRLEATRGISEVIVVAASESDDTSQTTTGSPFTRVVRARRGRGQQLNAGAQRAQGDVLLFVHADVTLPPDAAWWIEDALGDPECVAGAFRTWTVAEHGGRPVGSLLHLADVRSRYTGIPYGDQAMFVRADIFRELGGFAPMPLMEDYELSRRLRERGRVRTVPASVYVSGRRFQRRPIWYTFLVNVFPALYRAGVSPEILARLYGNPR